MHPPDCPSWEYNSHPDRQRVLGNGVTSILIELRTGVLDTHTNASDTRYVHGRLFNGLTPQNCEYYAGHYRGENFRCLLYYDVYIPGDPRVGCTPMYCLNAMDDLKNLISDSISNLDDLHTETNVPLYDKLLATISAACHIFEIFLRIHPYANGNGHAARFLIWTLLGRYGYWPERWPIEPRPADPPYTRLIVEHRNGNPLPLETFILNCIV